MTAGGKGIRKASWGGEGAGTDGDAGSGEEPLRVSTLELFFDLVFVFAITQLTGVLARDLTLASAGRVLLIGGVLWWMYSAYVWLANTRPPERNPERLLMLLGMAGFLIVGLALPRGFGPHASGRDGVTLGLGYLLLVLVHTGAHPAVRAGTRGRFAIRPDHFAERHGSLVIIVFGESVADIGIGIGTTGQVLTASLVVSAVLGLALAATAAGSGSAWPRRSRC